MFNCCVVFSQNVARISYKVVPTGGSLERNSEVLKSKVASSFEGVDAAFSRLVYELVVNEDRSYFYLNSILDFNKKAARLARAFAGNNEYFKKDKNKTIVKKIDFSNEFFYVQIDSVSNWNLVNEQKVINGYTCFKATRDKKLRLKMNDPTYVVEAWYCPSIPISNGPKEFGDLPGLILELQDGKITFLANKIELGDDVALKIKETNHKTITETEFYAIVKKTVGETAEYLK